MIDLQQFCSTDENREYLLKPFSVGNFSYSTNGHILVRVPRRSDVPERPAHGKPTIEKLPIYSAEPPEFIERETVTLPEDMWPIECDFCEGTGKAHHPCQSCVCDCDECDGKGKIQPKRSVQLRGALFDLRYVRMILSLPGGRFAKTFDDAKKPNWFSFDGGVGCVMGLAKRYENHVDLNE